MGSLNINGTKIGQNRSTIRNIGGAYTESADRVESSTTVIGNQPQYGTTSDLTLTQYAAQKISDCVKITDAKTNALISLACNRGQMDV